MRLMLKARLGVLQQTSTGGQALAAVVAAPSKPDQTDTGALTYTTCWELYPAS